MRSFFASSNSPVPVRWAVALQHAISDQKAPSLDDLLPHDLGAHPVMAKKSIATGAITSGKRNRARGLNYASQVRLYNHVIMLVVAVL